MKPLFMGRAKEEAEAALEACDEALAALEDSGADLGAARRYRKRAAAALRARDAKAATEAARKGAATAKLLDRLHTAASEGIARLQIERDRMTKLGMNVKDVDSLIGAALSWMETTVERDGDPDFPAYAKAGESALEGLKLARSRIPRYKAAAAAVAAAEQAFRRTVEANRFVDPERFRFFVLKPAVKALESSYARLKANEFTEARDFAKSALEEAGRIREAYGRASDAFNGVTEAARALRGEGATLTDVDDLLILCRAALERGKFDDAGKVAGQARRRLEEIRDLYRSLVQRRRTAEETIAEVEQWGFDVRGARAILREAKALLDGGHYEEASTRLEDARAAAQSLRDTHRTTAARIAEMRRSLPDMQVSNPSAATEAAALLAKAEALLDEGHYRQCEESIHIASVLIADAGEPQRAARAEEPTKLIEAVQAAELKCPTCGGPLAAGGTCPTCGAPPGPENAGTQDLDMLERAVEEAREVMEEISREEETPPPEKPGARACAMCGGPLGDEGELCVKCLSLVKGRAA